MASIQCLIAVESLAHHNKTAMKLREEPSLLLARTCVDQLQTTLDEII
jgi:hypothetical protein